MENDVIHQQYGEDAHLSCQIQSKQLQKVVWQKNGYDVVKDSRHEWNWMEVSASHYVSTLTIRELKRQDFGVYSCIVISLYGRGVANVHLKGIYNVTLCSFENIKITCSNFQKLLFLMFSLFIIIVLI